MTNLFFPPGSLPQAAQFETKQALLLVDFQNEFISPDGGLFVDNTASFLPKLPSLVSQFRSKGDVFWVRTEFQQSQPLISPHTLSYGIVLREILESQSTISADGQDLEIRVQDPEAFLTPNPAQPRPQCCLPGTFGAQYSQEILAAIDESRDTCLVKSTYSAFEGTSLLQDLRMRLVTKLYVCGSLSNISVYATALHAVMNGLAVTIIEDFLGFRDESCHVTAVRRMADDMCADGIDYQELMDDLAGLLGDVVKEEDFSTRYQVSLSMPGSSGRACRTRPSPPATSLTSQRNEPRRLDSVAPRTDGPSSGRESLPRSDSSSRKSIRTGTPDASPPRKRPTSELELEEPEHKSSHKPSQRRASHGSPSIIASSPRKNRLRVRRPKKKGLDHTTNKGLTPPTSDLNRPVLESKSTSDIPAAREREAARRSDFLSEHSTLAQFSETETWSTMKQSSRTNRRKAVPPPAALGPDDFIGEGDSYILRDLVPMDMMDDIFTKLRSEVKWQKMFHRAGEVPRLVAVQGEIATSEDGSSSVVPIYRHPADESPELLPFTETVALIRNHAQEAVRHPLNHVLIQLYRGGEDNISEHSDKTLDIVRGSKIVNYSCGAMRTMTLRTKKSAFVASMIATEGTPRKEVEAAGNVDLSSDVAQESGSQQEQPAQQQPQQPPQQILGTTSSTSRPSQRIPLPHNSLFILGPQTNTHWLHSIRADKRPISERSPAELAYSAERISLTFRHIGTFIDTARQTIWGQGATAKEEENKKSILTGADAEREGERMIRAFGQENHLSLRWKWDEWYGEGFDVVNFVEKKEERSAEDVGRQQG